MEKEGYLPYSEFAHPNMINIYQKKGFFFWLLMSQPIFRPQPMMIYWMINSCHLMML